MIAKRGQSPIKALFMPLAIENKTVWILKIKNLSLDKTPYLRVNDDITQHKHQQRNKPGPPEYPAKIFRPG